MPTIIIQCAGRKSEAAGYMLDGSGRKVLLVADPASAPARAGFVNAHPDDISDNGMSWRDRLSEYNARHRDANPLRLSQAFQLYEAPEYEGLVSRFGLLHVFILSAGWGLISANFLTPRYDITLRQSADGYKRRKRAIAFNDFCMLPLVPSEPLIFVGGSDYLPLFAELTQSFNVPKIVYFNSTAPPLAPGCELRRFVCRKPDRRTNWHYECAARLAPGLLP